MNICSYSPVRIWDERGINARFSTLFKNVCYLLSTGGGGGIQSIQAGTNISVDDTDPQNPTISATGSAGIPTLSQVVNEGNVAGNSILVNFGGRTTEYTNGGIIYSIGPTLVGTFTIPNTNSETILPTTFGAPRTLVASVNGSFADASGDITVSTSADTIYTADGAVASNRTVDINSNTLSFTNGAVNFTVPSGNTNAFSIYDDSITANFLNVDADDRRLQFNPGDVSNIRTIFNNNSGDYPVTVGGAGTNPLYGRVQFGIQTDASEASIAFDNISVDGRSYVIGVSGTGSGLPTGGYYIADATAGAARIFIDGSGFVGIGTNIPVAPLNVSGGSGSIFVVSNSAFSQDRFFVTSDGGMTVVGDATGGGTVADNTLESTNQGQFTIKSVNASFDSFLERLKVGAGDDVVNTVFSNTNVGIGTASPTEALDVNGNIVATGTITPSDIRWKENIEKQENSLNLIKNLNPVSFFYKKDTGRNFQATKQYGLIAQEVEEIIPEIVTTDVNGYKGIQYTELISILLKSVQELSQEVALLKSQI